ncbi:MAG: hypothetical protein OXC91_01975 [Rhodobacteraceae bacterium]|nr:hypothetical protein [Paracoccaceae bacterium]
MQRPPSRLILSCTFAMLTGLLAACGGGSGGSEDTSAPNPPPTSASPTATNPASPVFHYGTMLHVGTQAAPGVAGLDRVGARSGIRLYAGERTDGTSEDTILAMFEQIAPSETIIFPITFRIRPTVRIVEGADAAFQEAVQDAVAIINSVLPQDRQIAFDATPVAAPTSLDAIPEDTISVEYSAPSQWTRIYPGATPSHGLAWRRLRFEDLDEPDNQTLAGWVGLNSESTMIYTGPNGQHVLRHYLVHELLHTLGFWGHTNETTDRFSDSILTDNGNFSGARPGTFVLSTEDKDMIHAAYTRVAPGVTRVGDITDLEPWSRVSAHQMGVFATDRGEVAFGVWARNDLVQPWAEGPAPTGTLAAASYDDEDTTGHWDGVFLGYTTPSGRAVTGDVRLAVRMADRAEGALTFSELEQGGNPWGDGEMAYAVTINANRFDNQGRTGPDAGVITGVFLGLNFEAMAGTLRRDDLAGAFGGKQ